MIIKINPNKCTCLKNKKLNCREQCPNRIFENNVCKKHSKKIFRTVHDYNLSVIQSYIRKYLTKRLIIRIYGPAYLNPLLSHDNIEPVSLEKIWENKNSIKQNICEIPRYLIFSYLDNSNKIRIYNIISLLKIKMYDNKNPITRERLNVDINKNIEDRIKFMKLHDLWNERLIEFDKISDQQQIINTITEITIIFNNNTIYLNNKDLEDINYRKLIQLYTECRNILNHSDNNFIYQKILEIRPFFMKTDIEIRVIKDKQKLQKIIFNEILDLLNIENIQSQIKYVCYIVLGAFMYVSPNIYQQYNSNLEFVT